MDGAAPPIRTGMAPQKELIVSATPQEIFERYTRAGLTHDAESQAEMFTTDGVLEAPLVPWRSPASGYTCSG
jgi:hypothetical protein